MHGVVKGNVRTGRVQAASDARADAAARSGHEHGAFAQIQQTGDFRRAHQDTVPFARSLVLWIPTCARSSTISSPAAAIEGSCCAQTYRVARHHRVRRSGRHGDLGLFCVEPRSFSRFHRLAADEVWHAYDGDPFRLILLHPDGSSEDVVMGRDVHAGQRVQFTLRPACGKPANSFPAAASPSTAVRWRPVLPRARSKHVRPQRSQAAGRAGRPISNA